MSGYNTAGNHTTTPTGDEKTYIFFEPDSKLNLVHHDNQKPDLRSFRTTKGATLTKIIEKITTKEFSGMCLLLRVV
jgi:hypothetical protein